jgi:ABC-type nitrate/sulfonate/bicarbonate transport system substrate-binding protein
MTTPFTLKKNLFPVLSLAFSFVTLFGGLSGGADLPLVRIAHGVFNEKAAVLWIGVEQDLFRRQGVEVQVIHIRSGPQTMAALASGDIQVAYTIAGSALSAAVGGMDVALFAGILNRADGEFVVAPTIRKAEDLIGKKVGVQSIGGGVWLLTMLALEHFRLEPVRDRISLMVVGDHPILTQALGTGKIDGAYLGYTFGTLLKEKGFRVMLDLAKAPILYQGLGLVARRPYLRQNPQLVDAVLRGTLEAVAFIQNPANKEVVLKSLAKNLRLTNIQEAENGYQALQWLHSLDITPNLKGVQNMQRLLAITNPRVAGVKAEDVVDEEAVQRMQKTSFYREILARAKK